MTATNGADEAKAEAVVDVPIATQPNDLDAIPGLLKDITAGVGALSSGGDEARHELLIKARTMVQALESPRETMIKHCWGQVGLMLVVFYQTLIESLLTHASRLGPWPALTLVSIRACGGLWPRMEISRKRSASSRKVLVLTRCCSVSEGSP